MNESAQLSELLEVLDGILSSDKVAKDAMSLSELDGFLAGMVVCPSAVLPKEWIRQVWGEGGLNAETVEELEATNALVTARFRQILTSLHQGFYNPVYDLDDNEQLDWSVWAGGFLRAMALRPEAWHMFGDHDGGLGGDDAHQAMFTLMRLCELSQLPEEERGEQLEIDEKMMAMGPDLIPEAILLLFGVKMAAHVPIPVSLQDTEVKVGRNAPCPCGSGKKYKHCCLDAA